MTFEPSDFAGADARFNRQAAGPARTLHHCINALRRGDRALVITAKHACESRALLTEMARLAGPDLRLVARVDGSEMAGELAHSLCKMGMTSGAPWGRVSTRRATPASFLIVDEADMLTAADLGVLADLADDATAAPVQVVLAGSNRLFANLCHPDADGFWRKVRLAIALEDPAHDSAPSLAGLAAEIARTQARLEAQKRIMAIFADNPAPAPHYDA